MDQTAHSGAESLRERYREVRRFTERLSEPLTAEDCVVQSMPEASPTRWHLGHTTWFFETFLLSRFVRGYRPFHPRFVQLFNSYYQAIGEPYPRARRGLLSRPGVAEIFAYRAEIDRCVEILLAAANDPLDRELRQIVEIGLHHEQQHQELMLTDVKHMFSCNPLYPAYRAAEPIRSGPSLPQQWRAFAEGLRWMGHAGEEFCFDNERPRHRVFVEAFELAARPVTNAEYMRFMEDGGYEQVGLWLSEGWAWAQEHNWRAPLYWVLADGVWQEFTLGGLRRLDPSEPVCHVSFYEADAFARWSGARLPTEAEWEAASESVPLAGHFVESGWLHPRAAVAPSKEESEEPSLVQLFGDVWEWTASAYLPYPGYRTPAGALGEYNGKFMCNQFVLRGGSCVTPQSHIRRTYRNFFGPAARWQFSGIRLAR